MPKLINVNGLSVGDVIEFGRYPQNLVEDNEVNRQLKKICNKSRLKLNSIWQSYEYSFAKGSFADIEFGDRKYRCLIRRKSYYKEYSDYKNNTFYSFSYEPILWKVLSIEDGRALLLSEKLIDEQDFCSKDNIRLIDGKIYWSNNYKHSNLRRWLNEVFYNEAFSEAEKKCIKTVNVKNDSSTTKKTPNQYACEDTEDQVFLLSYQEAATLFPDNKSRWKKATEYSKAKGFFAYRTPDEKYNNACWWLRSPDHKYNNNVRCVGYGGGIGDGGFSTANESANAGEGVAPAIIVEFRK